MSVNYTPDGYHTVTPYLIVDNGTKALDFYRDAFGANELFRLPMGDKIGHAEIMIGDTHLMLADEFPDMGADNDAEQAAERDESEQPRRMHRELHDLRAGCRCGLRQGRQRRRQGGPTGDA